MRWREKGEDGRMESLLGAPTLCQCHISPPPWAASNSPKIHLLYHAGTGEEERQVYIYLV